MSSTNFTIREFLQFNHLPQVAKLVSRKEYVERSKHVVLYKRYTYLRLNGFNLHTDGISGTVGQPVVIPDGYPGWMTVIQNDGRTAGYFTTMEQIAEVRIRYFLVRDSVCGFQRLPCRKGGQTYKKVTINEGEVLKYIRTYESPVYPRRVSFRRKPPRYAKCSKKDGKVIFLSHQTIGRFHAIATRRHFTVDHVFRVSNLLRLDRLELPLIVQILTDHPKSMKDFTGIVRLDSIQPQTVILISFLSNGVPKLSEVSVDSDVSLRYSAPSAISDRLLEHCQNFAEKWKNSIKYLDQRENRFEKKVKKRKIISSFIDRVRRTGSFRKKRYVVECRNPLNNRVGHIYETIGGNESTCSLETLDLPDINNDVTLKLRTYSEEGNYETIC